MSAKTNRSSSGAPLSAECVITREITVATGLFAPGHLGEFTRIVPFEMVDAVLAETGAAERRLRKLPARVVVYLLLAAALFEECGYLAVWRKLTAALGSIPIPQGHRGGAVGCAGPARSPPDAGPVRPAVRPGLGYPHRRRPLEGHADGRDRRHVP
ncbi:transposase domain-containing protein [Streptomyces sp. ISL-98]|uniref:transposase domain-containing protein n=1 Tax=Streptomyces sp. ISL-98 TaxID=2819192 RepID=UPI0020356F82|nr:transposase domain-containing protein [Streptomyces sp. ISL-98]